MTPRLAALVVLAALVLCGAAYAVGRSVKETTKVDPASTPTELVIRSEAVLVPSPGPDLPSLPTRTPTATPSTDTPSTDAPSTDEPSTDAPSTDTTDTTDVTDVTTDGPLETDVITDDTPPSDQTDVVVDQPSDSGGGDGGGGGG